MSEAIDNARNHFTRLRRVQAEKLFNDKEQEEHSRQAELGQVLPVLPKAHNA
jgi:hypothetical protein